MKAVIELFFIFFRIGLFTIGGGYAMLPLVEQTVLSHGWMTAEEIMNFIAVSESTPGPFAINTATYVGSRVCGIPGAAAATLGIVLPSFIVILSVAKFYTAFQKSHAVKGVMTGLRPAVIGLISSAFFGLAYSVFFPFGYSAAQFSSYMFRISAVIFIIMLLLIFKKINPIIIIVLSAAAGIVCGYAGEYAGLLK